jgi:hypothetical protein
MQTHDQCRSYLTLNKNTVVLFGKNSMTDTPPPAPDEIPQYIIDGLHRQDTQSLRAIEQYAADLREEREQRNAEPPGKEEVAENAGDGEELVDVESDSDSGGTTVIKKVPCGKECDGCPHGPYRYTVQRVDGKLKWEYEGPVQQ